MRFSRFRRSEEEEEDTIQRFREATNRVARAGDRAICFRPKIQGRAEDGKSRSVLVGIDDPWKSGHKRSVRSQSFETNLILGSLVSLRMARLSVSGRPSSWDEVAAENDRRGGGGGGGPRGRDEGASSIHPSVRHGTIFTTALWVKARRASFKFSLAVL